MTVKTTEKYWWHNTAYIQDYFQIFVFMLFIWHFNVKFFTDHFIEVICYIKTPLAVWLHSRIPPLWNIPMSFRNLVLHPTLHQPFSTTVFFCCSLWLIGLNSCSFLQSRQFQTVDPLFRFPYRDMLFTAKGRPSRFTAVNPKGKCSRISEEYINISSLWHTWMFSMEFAFQHLASQGTG